MHLYASMFIQMGDLVCRCYPLGAMSQPARKKTFLQYSREDGGYLSGGLKNRKAPAYKLPSLLERPDSLVYIVEGEMCAEALHEAIGDACHVLGEVVCNAWEQYRLVLGKGIRVSVSALQTRINQAESACVAWLHIFKSLVQMLQLLCPPGALRP